MSESKRKHNIPDDFLEILGQSESEILRFIGVTSDVEEYELNLTTSSDLLIKPTTKVDESTEEVVVKVEDEITDEEVAKETLDIIRDTEKEIATDLNKYLQDLKCFDFDKMSKEEIIEKIKCKCCQWSKLKKKKIIKNIYDALCKDKKCRLLSKRKRRRKRRRRRKRKKKITILPALKPTQDPDLIALERRKSGLNYIFKKSSEDDDFARRSPKTSEEKQHLHLHPPYEGTEIQDERKSSDQMTIKFESTIEKPTEKPKSLGSKAKDSIFVRKKMEPIVVDSLEDIYSSASSEFSNLQGLMSFDKIGKRKIHPSMFDMYLNEFNTIKDFAFVFVNNILDEAISKVNVQIIDPIERLTQLYSEDFPGEECQYIEKFSRKTASLYSSIYANDLTPQDGRDLISGIVQTWQIPKPWKHCIEFRGEKTDSCTTFYIFEVIWSKPTPTYPIPQVTVSVFFTIELSRIKPSLYPPKVTFVFETERYPFTPLDDIKHESFLDNIFDVKTQFFKQLRF